MLQPQHRYHGVPLVVLMGFMLFMASVTFAVVGRSSSADPQGTYLVPVAVVLGAIWVLGPLLALIGWIRRRANG